MTLEPTLRTATEVDVEALADVYRAAATTLGPEHYTPAQVEAWAAFANEQEAFQRFILNAHTLVAELDGRVVGFGGLTREGRLASLYVHPDHARRGIGTQITRALLELARAWSLSRVHLEASELSLGTFRKAGFRVEVEEVVERRNELFRRYRMALELTPPRTSP